MSLSVTVLGESHCFSDFPGPAGVPAENSSRVRSPAARWGNHTPACAGGTVADMAFVLLRYVESRHLLARGPQTEEM